MAGRGPLPKPDAQRRRRNKPEQTRELPATGPKGPIPKLPRRGRVAWHRQTRAWWDEVWRSPMAWEYQSADGLLELAYLIDEFHRNPTKELAGEIRLQRQEYGLTPASRRRLRWQVGAGASAKDDPGPPPAPVRQRRDHLKVVGDAEAG